MKHKKTTVNCGFFMLSHNVNYCLVCCEISGVDDNLYGTGLHCRLDFGQI